MSQLVHRQPTEYEQAFLALFGTAEVESKEELRAQLRDISIRNEPDGYVALRVGGSPPLTSQTGFPINGWYSDHDGGLVMMHLRAAFPPGQVFQLERYRPDGERIEDLAPALKTVRVQADRRRTTDALETPFLFDQDRGFLRPEERRNVEKN